MKRLACAAALFMLTISSAAVAQTATISGVVLTADSSNAPVRLARVTLNSVDRGGPAETVTTDANGRFVFRGLPAGRYAIQSTKRAWLDANYGASRLGRPGTPVAIRDAEQIGGLTIRMTRGAVITGIVRDSSGDPQPGVQVRVLQFVTRNGRRTLERPISTNPNDPITDDDGAYRAYGLPPGDYLVAAGLRIGSDSGGLGGEEFRQLGPSDVERALAPGTRIAFSADAVSQSRTAGAVTNAPVYFPGTTDLAAASTITLASGEERAGADIRFALLPAARVTGTLVIPTGGVPPGEGRSECRITPAGFEDLMAQPLAAATTRVGSDGVLLFPGIPPGRYTIACFAGRPSGPGGPVLEGWAETSLIVDGQDQEVSMAFGPGKTLSGRVVFVGAEPQPDAASEVQIVFNPVGRARLLRSFNTRPTADGTFKFSAVIPGGWAIAATPRPASRWTLQSMTLGGVEMHDSLVDATGVGELAELVVTFTDKPSELAGALQDAAGRPAAEFFVIAFSTDREAWTPTSRRIQSARPASDGAFSIKGLPAGEYFLAALTDVEPGEWLSPAFLDQVVAASVKVRVIDGEKTVQGLRIAR